MRTAKVEDHWRNIYKKPFKFSISKITYSNLKGLGDGDVSFNGGITAICGANGVGKSTLLNAISSVVSSDRLRTVPLTNQKLEGSMLLGEFVDSGSSVTRKIDIVADGIQANPETIDVESLWIDSAFDSPELINIFSGMTNINEFIEAEPSRQLTDVEKSLLSYIVGKEYENCEVFEIELEDIGLIPYFKVRANEVEYGSEAMGLGEISIHHILWNLNRIKNNSIVLIEEPETYLAPRSQEALLDGIAKIAIEKRLWIILTTHSSNIIKNIPYEHIRILSRVDKNVQISIPGSNLESMYSLGLKPNKTGVILVEDRCAREFTKCWLGRLNASLVQQYEILDIGSKDKIKNEIINFPRTTSWFKLFGLFDGNERSRLGNFKGKWNFSYLPSIQAPEEFLKIIAKALRNKLSEISGRDLLHINAALSNLDGVNYHDWIVEFPQQIGLGYEQLIAYLVEISISSEEFVEIYAQAYEEFESEFDK